ncbi:MAG TPA: RNA pseudouridine synthase, partial [Actinobacteria bacterium]|nr:RNA pseudouridine synthase [Actinomycetota bacterium]
MSEWAGIQAGRVVLADEAVLVLNKPAGISV